MAKRAKVTETPERPERSHEIATTGINSADKTHRVEVGELVVGGEVITAGMVRALAELLGGDGEPA